MHLGPEIVEKVFFDFRAIAGLDQNEQLIDRGFGLAAICLDTPDDLLAARRHRHFTDLDLGLEVLGQIRLNLDLLALLLLRLFENQGGADVSADQQVAHAHIDCQFGLFDVVVDDVIDLGTDRRQAV